jgi:CubicO group peptidase (beta-lactamase class C family)
LGSRVNSLTISSLKRRVDERLRKPNGSYGWEGTYGTYWWVNRKEQMVVVLFVPTPGRSLQYDFDNAVSQAVIE